jgi:hypothetical protein
MAHPTADWALQQFREALPGDYPYRRVIHDRVTAAPADATKSTADRIAAAQARDHVRSGHGRPVCMADPTADEAAESHRPRYSLGCIFFCSAARNRAPTSSGMG